MSLPGLSDTEARNLILSVGTHHKHRPLAPLTVGCLLRRTLAAGFTQGDCAHVLRVNTSQIGAFLNLTKLTPTIAELADWGRTTANRISFSSLSELSRLASVLSVADQTTFADAIREHRLTRSEVKATVQMALRSRRPVTECVATTLQRRPSVRKTHVLIGSILNQDTRNWIASLSGSVRSDHLRSAIAEFLPHHSDVRGQLTADRFILELPPSLRLKTYSLTPDIIEQRLNAYLETLSRSTA